MHPDTVCRSFHTQIILEEGAKAVSIVLIIDFLRNNEHLHIHGDIALMCIRCSNLFLRDNNKILLHNKNTDNPTRLDFLNDIHPHTYSNKKFETKLQLKSQIAI